jgi:hypothetical protein
MRSATGLMMLAWLVLTPCAYGQGFDALRSAEIIERPAESLSPEDLAIARDAQSRVQHELATDPSLQGIAEQGRSIVADSIAKQMADYQDATSPLPELERDGGVKPSLLICVSQSMGRGALQEIVDAARGMPDVVIVLRGVEEGQRFPDLMKRMREMLGEVKDAGGGRAHRHRSTGVHHAWGDPRADRDHGGRRRPHGCARGRAREQ